MKKGAKNRLIHDATVQHQIYLQRLVSRYGTEIITRLDISDSKLIRQLSKRLERFGPVGINASTAKRFRQIKKDVKKIRGAAIVESKKWVSDEFHELARNESAFAKKSVEAVLPGIISQAAPKAILMQIVKNGIFSGRTLNDWFSDLEANDTKRIMSTVRYGMSQGQTVDQIVRTLIGTAKANYQDGMLNVTRNEARALVRTTTNGVANSARYSFYSQNTDVISGLTYSATLDGRTSAICASLDGTMWKFPEESGEVRTPPLHPNCRSTLLPDVEGMEGITGRRPAANADFMKRAERRYDNKFREKGSGKRWKDLAASTRKRYYHQEMRHFEKEEQMPAFSQVPGKTSYKEWFATRSASFQQDILGKTRYKLYHQGNYKLDKFVDFNSGRKFTLQDLERKDKQTFKEIRRIKTNTKDFKAKYKELDDYKSYERFIGYGTNGEIIGEYNSGATGGTVPQKLRKKDLLFVHNHPIGWRYPADDIRRTGNSLSPADVSSAFSLNWREIRAVTPKRVYTMVRPEGGWPDVNLRREIHKSEIYARNLLNKNINKGRISIDTAGILHYNTVWRDFSNRFGIKYIKEKR